MLTLAPGHAGVTRLLAIQPHDADGRYVLRGEFGPDCGRCEVIVDYGGGLRYSAEIERWEPSRVLARIADLNAGLDVRVRVQAGAGASEWLALRLARVVVPRPVLDGPVESDWLRPGSFVERHHDLAVGDKGEERFEVGAPAPACGKRAALFDHARIVYVERRFGEARIVASPPPGCSTCPPLTVRWYHEPTGRLTYQLHVYRRLVEGACRPRVR